MKHQTIGARIKPDLVVVLACAFAAIVILAWIFKIQPTLHPQGSAAGTVARHSAPRMPPASGPPGPVSPVEEQWGIRVSSIQLTNTNLALELRYEVTDPAKAALLSDGATAASVLDPATGKTIRIGAPPERPGGVSQHSRARSAMLMMGDAGSFPPAPNRIVPGKTYTVQLPHPPDLVKKGSRVVVVIGDFRTDYITVD
jgi:hypothetical protein